MSDSGPLDDDATLDDYLAYHAAAGRSPAVWCGGEQRSYAELDDDVALWAGALRAAGVGEGDVVAVFANTRPECLAAFLACCRLGALYLGLNPKYTARELGYVCEDAKPALLLSVDDPLLSHAQRTTVQELARSLPPAVTVVGTPAGGATIEDFLATGEPVRATPGRSNDQPCAIVYTSGSTGSPKGALLSEAGCVRSGRLSWLYWYGGDEGARAVVQHPINHVGWLICECVAGLVGGASLFFRERFDGGETLRLIEEHQLTLWLAFPSMLALAMQSSQWDRCDLSSLRKVALGTSAQFELLKRFRERFDGTFCVSYGLTEAHGGAVTVTAADADLFEVASSIGRPVPGISVRVVDDEGNEVEDGTPGELLVEDPSVFLGYLNRPEATAEAIDSRGRLHTGDIVVRGPGGAMRHVGRKKEMYKSGGYNVYPSEIEGVIGDYGDVVHAAVVEAPDPLWEAVGVAFVVVADEPSFDLDRFVEFLRSRLANYKVPKRFVVVDALPELTNGKVDRVGLRQRARELVEPAATPLAAGH